MAGHVRKLATGRWQARFPRGGGRYRSKNFDRKIDADRWLRAQADARDRGAWVDPRQGRVLFIEVADEWMEMRSHLAASTLARDDSYLRSLVLPEFGDMAVAAITTEMVEAWVKGLRKSPATVHKAFQILSGVLDRAVKTRRLVVNPASLAEGLPRIETGEMRFLTVAEVEKIALAADSYETLIWTAALTGMRWAELVGLQWHHVDIEARTVSVVETLVEVNGRLITKPPKTAASRRQIALPESLRLSPGVGYVFTAPDGGPIRRSNFRRRVWEPIAEGARFHDLRHTHASWLIAEGVHPKVISSRLGHSSITVTMDRYGHLMEGLDTAAALSLDRLLTL